MVRRPSIEPEAAAWSGQEGAGGGLHLAVQLAVVELGPAVRGGQTEAGGGLQRGANRDYRAQRLLRCDPDG